MSMLANRGPLNTKVRTSCFFCVIREVFKHGLGDGIFSSDSELRGVQRKTIKDQNEMGFESFNLLTSYMKAYKEEGGASGNPNKLLRDTLLSLMIAGRSRHNKHCYHLVLLAPSNKSVSGNQDSRRD